jgi:hypothetical protein
MDQAHLHSPHEMCKTKKVQLWKDLYNFFVMKQLTQITHLKVVKMVQELKIVAWLESKKFIILFNKGIKTRSSYYCNNVVAWSLPMWSIMQSTPSKCGSSINMNIIWVFSQKKVYAKPKKGHNTLITFATILHINFLSYNQIPHIKMEEQ